MTPLRRFAAADLLLFRHKTRESDQLLDSLSKAFPQTPLQDDIDMLRAKIAMEEGRWGDAAAFLKTILDQYGTDVLGDDAAYKLAGIYRDHLEDKEKALFYFEKLITDYPGSTYIQEARKAYQALKDSAAPAS
jgi:outer membrane protein assembly factor BamD (BamD/ComL family)